MLNKPLATNLLELSWLFDWILKAQTLQHLHLSASNFYSKHKNLAKRKGFLHIMLYQFWSWFYNSFANCSSATASFVQVTQDHFVAR